ncbi:MAG TPA: amidase family protein, partial [Bacillota bacterium]|nr:amidase family protein [Bacillota bacterium]
LILSPTTPDVAYDFNTMSNNIPDVYKQDTCTVPANLAGLPAISIPCGFDKQGLPIGMQLMGRPYGEGTLLRAAYAFEQTTTFHKKRVNSLEV